MQSFSIDNLSLVSGIPATSAGVERDLIASAIHPSSMASRGHSAFRLRIAVASLATIGCGLCATTAAQPGSGLPAAATPVISLASGTYPSAQTVSIMDTTPGSTIYYTTNGALPTANSTKYTTAISVSATETLVAVAIAPNFSTSVPAAAEYVIGPSGAQLAYTIAGNGISGYSGDGGPATVAQLNYVYGTAHDGNGNLYIADIDANVIRKVAAGTGIITTFAGTGVAGSDGNGGAATDAQLNAPQGVAVDGAGNVYIADSANYEVRVVSAATGIITAFAGNGTPGLGGDNGLATSAQLGFPEGLAFDGAGDLFIADSNRIRKVATGTGIITTIAGGGLGGLCSGDGGPATSATLEFLQGIAADAAGDVFYADAYCGAIREISVGNGQINTVAGMNGFFTNDGYMGDGGPATSAELNYPRAVAIDGNGNLYIGDWLNYVIREVTHSTGIITTVFGNNSNACIENMYSGDGGLAVSASFCFGEGIESDTSGNLYFSDGYRVREVPVSGPAPTAQAATPIFSLSTGTYANPQSLTITDATPGSTIHFTFNGSTPNGASPQYYGPINVSGPVTIQAVAIAPGYLASAPVSATYTITPEPTAAIQTVAGSGTQGFSGAGQAATGAEFSFPNGIALDLAGNRYIADTNNNVVWMVSANSGIIAIFAGNGTPGYTGDNTAATTAQLNEPRGVAFDSGGNLYIADTQNQVIRKVDASTGIITTVAGNGKQPPCCGTIAGDGGQATSAELYYPFAVRLDNSGNLYIADFSEYAIRKVTASTGIITTVAGNGKSGQSGIGGPATSAELEGPEGIALDSAGNLFIADSGRILKVAAATGILTTVAGNGTTGYSGDGEPATDAEIQSYSVAVDPAGNIYFGTFFGVREVSASTGIITTIAGNKTWVYSGDGGSATMAGICDADGLALDATGDLFIADTCDYVVREVTFTNRPTVTVTPSALSITTDQPLTVTVAVSGGNGNPTPTGSVILTGCGFTSPSTPLDSGSASFDFPIGTLAGGSDVFSAVYTPENASSSTYIDSWGSSASVTVTPVVAATPTFSVGTGTYTTAQTVTIKDATPGAAIYYTTNGTTPTTSSALYKTQIAVPASETILAIAAVTGYTQSAVAAATYTINLPVAETPLISLAAGEYSGAQTVTIHDSTPGASIYYTTDGSYPYSNFVTYMGPVTVSSSETLVAIAVAPGYSMSAAAIAQYIIDSSSTSFVYSIAGIGVQGYSGDGGPATLAQLNDVQKTIADGAGNLYIADSENNRVREIAAATGLISTIAGTGIAGYSGDNQAAIDAQLSNPTSLAFDLAGNLYIADSSNGVIRKLTISTGIITTFAGGGSGGIGDNGPATSAQLAYPRGIAFDGAGNLYIGDLGNRRIRKVAAGTGTITTVAGNGSFGCGGDGGPATSAEIDYPYGLAADSAGDVYYADSECQVVRKVSVGNGEINTIAGINGGAWADPGYSGDGGPATSAKLYYPEDVAIDGSGNLFIADTLNAVIRKVAASNGVITTVAGDGGVCDPQTGEGGPALSAGFCETPDIAVDRDGNLYVSDYLQRLYKVTVAAAPTTKAAEAPVFSLSPGIYSGSQTVTVTDLTRGASIHITMDGTTPNGLSYGHNGSIQITGTATIKAIAIAPGYLQSPIATAAYTITSPPPTVINTIAGDGIEGFSGIGGPAKKAEIGDIQAVALDKNGNLYLADATNNVVWTMTAKAGNISVLAGNGTRGFSGDGGLAINAELSNPEAVALDGSGNLYIADANNHVVREVNATTGAITTIAGNGTQAPYGSIVGDGGQATAAELGNPDGVAIDGAGNLYISDSDDFVVRKVTAATGIITTIAGTGMSTYSGDGGPATSAGIEYPEGIAFDGAGNLYIVDDSGRIRKVAPVTGIITTVAGNGDAGESGDGGLATSAEISAQGIALDSTGNLYFPTSWHAVREVSAKTGVISTVAGNGFFGYSGDGGSATMADLLDPAGIAVDTMGRLYFADSANYRVREVSAQTSPAITWATPKALTYGTALSATELNASSSVPGKFVYTPAAGTVLKAGSHMLSVTFTPTDDIDYRTVTASVTLTVDKATPAVTWATPKPISYGVALSATQLNASSKTAGKFTYSPAAGTLLSAGLHKLAVTLAPTDSVDYSAAAGSVTLTVDKATQPITFKKVSTPVIYGTSPMTLTATSGSHLAIAFKVTGPATVSGDKLTITGAGTVVITASQAGDANYDPAPSVSQSITVDKATPTAKLAVSAGSVVQGKSVTFTATLTGGGTKPTGTVTFLNGTASLGTAALSSSGVATLTTTKLAVGKHSVTASYGGNGNYAKAISTSVTVVVNAP
jgi:sugar lactone lactonase YvrE